MIDWTRYEALRDDIGADCLDEVVALFLEEVEEGVSRLRAHPTGPDLGASLHFLKGCALNLGFREFSTLCQQGETLCAQDRMDDVDLSHILSCYDASLQEFTEHRQKAGAA